jgi:hypothetical protein
LTELRKTPFIRSRGKAKICLGECCVCYSSDTGATMLKSTERQIYGYDILISKRATHAVPPTMAAIVNALDIMGKSGAAVHAREKDTVLYRIGEINVDAGRQVARILIRRCDKNAANAAYSSFSTGALDIKKKAADQGGDKAAHLVVSLIEETGKPHTYLAHLEGVPGISHTFVQALFNAVIRDAAKKDPAMFRYPDPSGAKTKGGEIKTSPFVPHIELQGHLSDEFKSDVENGVLSEIMLVQHTAKQKFGGSAYLVEKENYVRLAVDKNMPQQGRLGSLLNVFRGHGMNFNEARLRFKDPDGVPRHVAVDIDTGTPQQGIYIKSFAIRGINPPMDESCDTLQPFITEEITKRVAKERK